MRNRLKRNMALMSIAIILIFNIENVATCVYGSEIENNEISYTETDEEFSDFSEIKDDYEYIGNKVEDEVNQSSGIIENEELEIYLNENGVFDEEIEDIYSHEEIEELNEAIEENMENLQIHVEYYAGNDTEENVENIEDVENTTIEESMIRLTDEEVNMYIAESCYGIETNLNESLSERMDNEDADNEDNSDINLGEEIMSTIGLAPQTVYASADYERTQSAGGQGATNKTMLKKTVQVYKVSEKTAKTHVTYTWEIMPVNRGVDAMKIGLSGLITDGSKEASGKHKIVQKVWDGPLGCASKVERYNNDLKLINAGTLGNNEFKLKGDSVWIAAELRNNEDMLKSNGDVYKRKVLSEIVDVSFYCDIINSRVWITPEYRHTIEGGVTYSLVDLARIVVSAANEDIKGIAFVLASGKKVSPSSEMSGVDKSFEFILVYK